MDKKKAGVLAAAVLLIILLIVCLRSCSGNAEEKNPASETSSVGVSTEATVEKGPESQADTTQPEAEEGSSAESTDSSDEEAAKSTESAVLVENEGDVEIIIPDDMDSEGF